MAKAKILDESIYSTGQLSWWSKRRGMCVHNDSCLQLDTDSQMEERIARAIEQAYREGYQNGYAKGRETLEERLGA